MRLWLLAITLPGLCAAGLPTASLSSYVGKYPFNKVSGLSLYSHPKFRLLVNGAAPNSSISETILNGGVETPIERQGALVVIRACEPHNCGSHQWTVAVLSPDGPAAICYHDQDLMDDEARWFVGGYLVGQTKGCWKGDHTNVPDAVLLALMRGQ